MTQKGVAKEENLTLASNTYDQDYMNNFDLNQIQTAQVEKLQ